MVRIQQKPLSVKMKGPVVILMVALIQLFAVPGVHATQSNDLGREVETLFIQPDGDLAAIKLAVDGMLDPSVDIGVGAAKIDAMSSHLRGMIPSGASEADKLQYLRQFLYEAGRWNGNRPFEYDLSDPLGTHPDNRKRRRPDEVDQLCQRCHHHLPVFADPPLAGPGDHPQGWHRADGQLVRPRSDRQD
ncbi:hypothetical protein [Ensifer sp. Root31]|uniref:hypothetical protein n=1 Tax=Ensifer sp. Root31 TaxID=1736512 RepID=UPI0012E71E8A|nr:hypothetical protein [Ensifer sp. Root31]